MSDVVASVAAAPPPPNKEADLNPTRNPSKRDDFTRTISKISVAQICENVGFQGFQNSSLDSLSDVAIRYIVELGKTSNKYANLAGRSQCTVFDLIQGLEELGSVQGFPGLSDARRPLSNSGVVREISQYVSFVESVPFLFSVPRFPVARERDLGWSFQLLGELPAGEHIPPWLPAFPGVEKEKEEVGVRMVKDETREKPAVNDNGIGLGLEGNVNPFLVPPLRYGEKEVSSVGPPLRFFDRNHGNMMERFGLMDGNEGERNKLRVIEERNEGLKVEERPTVRFRISNVKNSPLCLTKSLLGKKKIAHFFETDEEIDEKKRRAEEISNESMEARTDEQVDEKKRTDEEALKDSIEARIGEEVDEKKRTDEEVLKDSVEARIDEEVDEKKTRAVEILKESKEAVSDC